ncbi:MAG: hypothetical protein RLZZ15_1597, partial [Verrucomicrobiota bacterium]
PAHKDVSDFVARMVEYLPADLARFTPAIR